MTLNNIFGSPIEIEGLGLVYPVKLKNWDKFEKNIQPITFSKKHFETNQDMPLLDMLIYGFMSDEIVNSLCEIFNIVLKSKEFSIEPDGNNGFVFINENKQIINSQNYEELRKVILSQNIIFEPKIYKNPALQKWAEKVLKTRSKNSPNVTLEDMLSTISVMSGKHYWDLQEYTIYQLKYDFNRICRIKNYESQSIMFANPYADLSKMKMEHFAENIDMYENPYDGIFKEKSSLSNLNSVIQG
jgi:hypothetical protein